MPTYTDEELLAETRAAHLRGGIPFDWVPQFSGAKPEPERGPAPSSFLARLQEELGAETGQPFTLPGTSLTVYVFGLDARDYAEIQDWNDRRERAASRTDRERVIELTVYQCIVCTRQGETKDNPRAFEASDFERLTRLLKLPVIQRITAICDELSGEGEGVGNSIASFFTSVRLCSQTISSLCATFTACLTGSNSTPAATGSAASSSSSPGSGSSGRTDAALAQWERVEPLLDVTAALAERIQTRRLVDPRTAQELVDLVFAWQEVQ